MAIKLLMGLILLLIGLWLLIPGIVISGYSSGLWLTDFVSLIKGLIPPILLFIGFILAWIDWEEINAAKPTRKR
jgi:hypothetical protein